MEFIRKEAIKSIRSSIQSNLLELHPYQNRRNNYRPAFRIQLTITSPRREMTENVDYTTKLHGAEKSLLNFMFGKRRHIVYIKNLSVACFYSLRLPIGTRFKVRELETVGNIAGMINPLKTVVEESSFPLEQLKVLNIGEDQDFGHEVMKSSEILIISGWRGMGMDYFPAFQQFRNKFVHKDRLARLSIENYVHLIRNWLRDGRELGTCYTFAFKDIEDISKIMNLVEQQIEGVVVEDKCLTILINSCSKLEVSYEPIDKTGFAEKWILKMLVVPIESSNITD